MVGSRIKTLLEEVMKAERSRRNREIQRIWQPASPNTKRFFFGAPRDTRSMPITVDLEIPMWAKLLDFDVQQFYTRPEKYLENLLKISLYKFRTFKDDTEIGRTIRIWFGVVLEPSLFGLEPVYFSDHSPWIPKQPVIRNEEDLDDLGYPDFYRSGLMPLAHEFYESISRTVSDDFRVIFPEWDRGPFGMAIALRGMENMLKDTIKRPDFVHKLMKFVTESRIRWTKDRSSFLGHVVEKGDLYDDEVNSPMLSPTRFQEFVLPYELELCNFHGGIYYWHSCGNIAPLLTQLRKIPILDYLHVGPWTDLEAVLDVFEKTPLMICLNPLEDVQTATDQKIRSKITRIVNSCLERDTPFNIRADGLQVISTLKRDLVRIRHWIRISRETIKHMKLDSPSQYD